MSIAAQSRVWDNSQQDGTNLIALLALADWSDADGVCWYSNRRIAQRVRRQERTVTRILERLRKSGEVYAPPQRGAGRKTLKFITVGMERPQIEDILTRRFELTPLEARAAANRILSRQKPVTDDGFNQVENPSSVTGLIEEKPVTDDGYKPVTGDGFICRG